MTLLGAAAGDGWGGAGGGGMVGSDGIRERRGWDVRRGSKGVDHCF